MTATSRDAADSAGFELDPSSPNIVPIKYRQVALATVDFELSEELLQEHFVGREAYMTTRYHAVHRGREPGRRRSGRSREGTEH